MDMRVLLKGFIGYRKTEMQRNNGTKRPCYSVALKLLAEHRGLHGQAIAHVGDVIFQIVVILAVRFLGFCAYIFFALLEAPLQRDDRCAAAEFRPV